MPRWWDHGVLVATLLALGILGADVADLGEPFHSYLVWSDFAVCALFAVDFGVRARRADNRLTFLKRNWFDLLGAIPVVGPLRAARLVRVVRIVRLMRAGALIGRLLRRYDVRIPWGSFGYLFGLTGVIWFAAASAIFLLESDTNEGIASLGDALWWSMTTLSTVGYGDLYPSTTGGRVVAMITMILGIGVLGTVAGAIASALVEAKERGRKGLRSYSMKDHLLVLGFGKAATSAIRDFRQDPRHARTPVVLVCDLPESPLDDAGVRFVRGQPGRKEVLERAGAADAACAIVLARDASDARSDHETTLSVLALRRLNDRVRIGAELIDPDNREHLEAAGCDAVIDGQHLSAMLLVRSVQDMGVSEVVAELLSNSFGCEIYRVPVSGGFTGKSYRDYAVAMVDRSHAVLGLVRAGKILVNPGVELTLEAGDEAFLVSSTPP